MNARVDTGETIAGDFQLITVNIKHTKGIQERTSQLIIV
jgi:hypothetical protein